MAPLPKCLQLGSPDWLGAESVQVIPDEPCVNCSGGAYFQAVFDGAPNPNTIIKYPLTGLRRVGWQRSR
jgi:hypothetical protein